MTHSKSSTIIFWQTQTSWLFSTFEGGWISEKLDCFCVLCFGKPSGVAQDTAENQTWSGVRKWYKSRLLIPLGHLGIDYVRNVISIDTRTELIKWILRLMSTFDKCLPVLAFLVSVSSVNYLSKHRTFLHIRNSLPPLGRTTWSPPSYRPSSMVDSCARRSLSVNVNEHPGIASVGSNFHDRHLCSVHSRTCRELKNMVILSQIKS